MTRHDWNETTVTDPNRKSETQRREQAGGARSAVTVPEERGGHARTRREIGNLELKDLNAYYGTNHAVRGVDMEFSSDKVTAIIGPSGCGKSTMVRCINRMHEEIPSARAAGEVLLDGINLYASN